MNKKNIFVAVGQSYWNRLQVDGGILYVTAVNAPASFDRKACVIFTAIDSLSFHGAQIYPSKFQ